MNTHSEDRRHNIVETIEPGISKRVRLLGPISLQAAIHQSIVVDAYKAGTSPIQLIVQSLYGGKFLIVSIKSELVEPIGKSMVTTILCKIP